MNRIEARSLIGMGRGGTIPGVVAIDSAHSNMGWTVFRQIAVQTKRNPHELAALILI